MDKTMFSGNAVEGSALAVSELLRDPTAHSSTTEAIAMVYMESTASTTKLQDHCGLQIRNIKNCLSDQHDSIVTNATQIAEQAKVQAEQASAQAEQAKVQEELAKVQAEQVKVQAEQANELKNLKARTGSPGASASSNQHLFATDMGSLVMQCLPVLYDGMLGIMVWVPVYENNHLYVVLSKGIAQQTIKPMVSTDVNIRPIFDGLKPAVAFAHNNGSDIAKRTLFMNIMKKTPFGVRKTSLKQWTKNLELYSVMDGDYWKPLMQYIVDEYAETRPLVMPDSVKNMKVHPRYFPLSLSLRSPVGEDVEYVNMGETLTPDDLSLMPSWRKNWWLETYRNGADRYFGMEEVDGKLGHVQSGVYVPPEGKVYARSYEVTLDAYAKKNAELAAKNKSNKRRRGARSRS